MLNTKLDILQRAEGVSALGHAYNLAESTICDINKNAEKIQIDVFHSTPLFAMVNMRQRRKAHI